MPVHCFKRSGVRPLLAVFVLVCCASARAELIITQAWVRAVPPVSSGTAGYFSLENNSAEPVRISGVHAKFARHVMMHSMARNAEGLREMQHVPSVSVPPGESVQFAPGGMHLMLMGLDSVPAAGEVVEICLEREPGEPLCHDFEVRREQP